MKKKIIVLILILLISILTDSCGYYNPENAGNTKETIVPDYMKVDNDSVFLYDKNDTTYPDINDSTEMQTIEELSFFHSSITELYKKAPYKLLRENNGVYYTMYCLNNQRICYVIFANTNGIMTVHYPWVYSDTQVSRDRFKEVVDIKKPVVGTQDFF